MANNSASQQGIGLRYYWYLIRKRLWMLVAFVLLGGILGLILALHTQPVYQATVQLLLETDSTNVIAFDEIVVRNKAEDYYQTQYRLMQAPSLARRVIDTLQLQQHPEFASPASNPGGIYALWSHAGSLLASIRDWVSALIPPEVAALLTPAESAPAPESDTALVERFLQRLKVEPVPKSHLVDVSFEAHDPRLAAEVVNTLAQLYIAQNLELRFAAIQDALNWLNQGVHNMRQKAEDAELALQQYKEEHDIISIEDHQELVGEQLAALNTALSQAKTERLDLQTLYKELQRLSRQPELIEAMPSVADDAVLQELKSNYVALQRALAQAQLRYRSAYPRLVELRTQLEATQKKIDTTVRKIVRGVKAKYELARSREVTLRRALDQQKLEAQELNKKSIRYHVLSREVKSNERLYDILLTRLKEVDLSSELKSNNIRIINAGIVPQSPINAQPVQQVLQVSSFGLLLGIGLIFCADHLSNGFRTPEEARDQLELPVIGTIGPFRCASPSGKQSGLITAHQPLSPTAEAFKTLRTNLLFSHTNSPCKVLLVASPHAKAGKTTVAANLAIVMAQMNQRVLLIDADLRNPTLHKIFYLGKRTGLSDVLSAEQYADHLHERQKNLTVVPCDMRSPKNPGELLASKQMQRFLEFARAHYDMVIIDSPPILAASDALVLSTLADGTILVLPTSSTPRDDARNAITQLTTLQRGLLTAGGQEAEETGQSKILGLVMNFVDPRVSSYASYAYYNDYHSSKET